MGPSRTLQPRSESTIEHIPLPQPEAHPCTFYENWVHAIHGDDTLIVTHNEISETLHIMDMAFKSGQTGKVVAL